jgi:hypothetical protein
MTTRIDAAAWYARMQRVISQALTQTMLEFEHGADTAYSGTRFAGTFRIEPAPILTEASLLSSDPLLVVVEFPTRPHPITARNSPNLVFYWERAGRWFIGPSVSHPGTSGKHYIEPLWEQAGARFGELLNQGLESLNRVQ